MSDDSKTWTEDRVQQLRFLWASGLSSTRIGVEMGLSRNAIIGKVHRLKLPTPTLKQEVIRNREYTKRLRDPAKEAARKSKWRAARKGRDHAEARERSLAHGHSRYSAVYRSLLPKLPPMTKGELRSMLSDALQNTARMACTP